MKVQQRKVKVKKMAAMDDHHPLVSVILPFYNAPFLQDAIESILHQSYPNFELILIDNGSTDSSSEIAKKYMDHPKVKLKNEARRGVVFAVNKGIELSEGHFIARMDADDISAPNRLRVQIEHLQKNPTVGVVSGLIEYNGPESNQGFKQYVDWLNSIVTHEDIYLNQFVEFPLANPSLMFRKEIFDAEAYREGDFPEDYELFLRLQSMRIGMSKVDEYILSWRDSDTRLTRTDPRYDQDAFFRIKAKYLAKWLALNNPKHPNIYLWGAGRLSRRRSDYLLKEGIEVIKYIDLKQSDQVLHFEFIPDPSKAFIVSYVANRGARAKIRTFLNQKGFKEGSNFIMAS